MAIRELDARIGALREYLNRRGPNVENVFNLYDTAKILGINWHTLKAWTDHGYVKPLVSENSQFCFNMNRVLEDLEKHQLAQSSEVTPPEAAPEPSGTVARLVQSEFVDKPSHPAPDLFSSVRERAMKAAREAYRDEILEAADQAEKAGNPALANRFYKDFIHMEEGLKVIYESK